MRKEVRKVVEIEVKDIIYRKNYNKDRIYDYPC